MSLWGEEFTVVTPPKQQKKLIDKVSKPKQVTVQKEKVAKSKTLSIREKLAIIREEVLRILGVYKEQTIVLRTYDELKDYIDKAIINNEIAVDTETNNSLEPITCKLMGLCLYTPGLKNAYIPVNHVDIDTGVLLPNQLTEAQIKEQLDRLVNTKIIMHNGKFDYQVLKCTCDSDLEIYWDTLIGSRILDENERANLKQQYISKIDPSIEKYSIEKLFDGIEYALVDPELFALYAATDAFMTYKLYKWQQEQFSIVGHERLFSLFKDIEMPIVRVAADMELTGVEIDFEYAKRLSEKYHKKVDAVDAQIELALKEYDVPISEWRKTPEANHKEQKTNKKGEVTWSKSKNEQLADPVSVTSPTQLAILLYDVLKVGVIDKKTPRGTGEEILLKIDLPICKLILEKRGLEKLIGTYIDKLPQCVCPKTNRLHAHFNQIGADTGRFSSSEPNLQNIPSHVKSIRMMFKAAEGCVLVGSDFSQQEPRLLSQYSQDDNMINAYKQGKDLYATIAAGVYNNEYRLNLEFETNPDGSWKLDDSGERIGYPEGKKRRSNCKSLLLGIMYGRGAASIAEQIGGTMQDAQKIIDDFYKSFPNVKKWIEQTETSAKKTGYVEDLWGRRRRLPDIQLPQFDVRYTDSSKVSVPANFNPLLGSTGKYVTSTKSDIDLYREKAMACRGWKQIDAVKKEALTKGIEIHDNGGFIAQAQRQCVNARIQGGAATMSKRAMIKVHNDPQLREWGFKLMLAVHDELIGECPIENQDKVADRLCELMKNAALPEVTVPFKCDPTIESSWYYSDYSDGARESYTKFISEGLSEHDAFMKVAEDRYECTHEQLKLMLGIPA